MAKSDAKKAMKESILSGYRHHSYNQVRQTLNLFLTGKAQIDTFSIMNFYMYENMLGPNRLRSLKNGLICFITVVSREAIELGVAVEQSFSLSDYYVALIEEQETVQQAANLLHEILESYAELVTAEQYRQFSLPVTRAIRYMANHLYEPILIKDVALHINLNPQYFAGIFKKEVGLSPFEYIRIKKMKEASALLLQTNESILGIAEALGYCNSSHFIRAFKAVYNTTPKAFSRWQY